VVVQPRKRLNRLVFGLAVLAIVAVSVAACGGGGGGGDRSALASAEIAFLAPPAGASGDDAVFALPDCSSVSSADVCGSSIVDLYVVRADGTERHRLTLEGGFLLEREYFAGVWDRPMWAPDGSSLMLTRGMADPESESLYGRFEVWTVGQSTARRVASGLSPSWSPDGASIAYTHPEGDSSSVVILDLAGGNERVLVRSADLPHWSPNGSSILYTPFGKNVTWAVTPDGNSAPKRLFVGAEAEWSPDGRSIAYKGECGGDDYALCVSDADRSGTHQLAKFDWIGGFAWSPDGTQIAVVEVTYDHDTAGDLHVVNADGTGLTKIATDVVGYPSWAPDGTRIAIAKLAEPGEMVRQNTVSIFTVKPDGTDLRRVPNGPFDLHPAWKPTATTND
jgi:Tol biopolymer transport system component